MIQELTHHMEKEENPGLLKRDTDSLPHSIAKKERKQTLDSEMENREHYLKMSHFDTIL